MLNGFWVHNPPIGFKYERSPNGGSVLTRIEPLASIIAEGLEGYASGRFNSRAEVKRFFEAHPEFPLCRHGFLTNQQAHRIMTHPIYAGYIESKVWGVSLRKGQHKGVISLETFEKIQERLSGKPLIATRRDINEDFPMRGYVVCGCCKQPLTANWSKGRNTAYPYYICRHRGCEKFGKSVARDKIENAYQELLKALVPSSQLFDLMISLFKKRWDQSEARAKESRAAMKLEVNAIEKKITQVLDLMVASDNKTVLGAFERKIEELERQKLIIAEKTARCGTSAKGFDETFRTAFEFISSPWNLWENGTLEDKRIVLKLTLASHIEYDWNLGVRTAEISLPFRVLGDDFFLESKMADREGVKPLCFY